MKKQVFTAFMLFVALVTYCQDSFKNGNSGYVLSSNTHLTQKKANEIYFGFYADPLGFVTFGPRVGIELTLQSSLVTSWFRFSKLGALMYVVTSDTEEGDFTEAIDGGAVGFEYAYFIKKEKGGFYFGPLLEYGWTTCYFEQGNNDEWVKYLNYIDFGVNGGYKFKFTSGFFFKAGGAFGAAFSFVNEWQYASNYYDDTEIHDLGHGVSPFGYLEFALGVEF